MKNLIAFLLLIFTGSLTALPHEMNPSEAVSTNQINNINRQVSEAPASIEGGYRVYTEAGEMGKIPPIYAYIYPTESENKYLINGLYADITIYVNHNPETGTIIFPKQKFIIGGDSYDFLPVKMNSGSIEYPNELPYSWDTTPDGLTCYFYNAPANISDVLVFNYSNWYEYSPFSSMFGPVRFQPIDNYLEMTPITRPFEYHPADWEEAGTATFYDCWLPETDETDEEGVELTCLINSTDRNQLLLKNPYITFNQSHEFYPEDGYLIIDIENPDCVKLLPTVSAGVNAKAVGLEDCLDDENLCMYNLAGYHYYLSLTAEATQKLSEYIDNPDSKLSTFDGKNIHINDYCFSTNKTNLFEKRTWNDNPRHGRIILSDEVIKRLSTGISWSSSTEIGYSIGLNNGILSLERLTSGDLISIYAIDGQKIHSRTANDSSLEFRLPKGVYLIRVNSSTSKISI